MAARRAPGSGKGAIFAAAFFAITTLTATILAIVAYGDLDKQRKDAEQARQELRNFATDAELSTTDVGRLLGEAKKNNRSAYKFQGEQIDGLKRFLTGDVNASVTDIGKQLRAVGVPEGQAVVNVITDLRDKNDVKDKNIEGLQAEIASNKKDLQGLATRYESVKGEREKQVKVLEEAITKLQGEIEVHRKNTDKTLAEANQKHEETQAQAAERLLAAQNQAKALQTEITRLEIRVKELRSVIAETSPKPDHLVGQIDGRILSVNPDQNLVYVNIGRRDHLQLGTTFEVYDPVRGIEVTKDSATGKINLKRGKATIEVMELDDDTAVCRVIRSLRSQTILAKDLIANIAYDRKRQFKFFVFGNFDLDGDGTHTLADYNLVVELIRKWGGKVVREEDRRESVVALLGEQKAGELQLPLDTDYIVIGSEPEPPAPLKEEQKANPDEVKAWLEAQKTWQKFSQIQDQARQLAVPIINQHRFLDLVGYYR